MSRTGHDLDKRIRRKYALARRPFPILMLMHAAPGKLAETSLGDLREWSRGIDAAIRREREKGALAHWAYDLNRHIALKSARDRLDTEIRRREAAAQKRKKPRSGPRLRSIQGKNLS